MIINENLNHLIGVTWGVLGAAEACYEIARDYVIERKQFDIPLSQNQIIQQNKVKKSIIVNEVSNESESMQSDNSSVSDTKPSINNTK